ncbi:hypothetical protein [Sphingomonas sp.]|uniref:hypothetical protein n=1 Tax=Sphingomonas sp. TaxID=28214 RepID=UPI003CC6B916
MLRITSSSLRINSVPHNAPTSFAPSTTTGLAARFSLNRRLEAIGSITIAGSAGDSTAGWAAGFVQAQWIETNWGFYSGAHDHDGSSFLQRARPPSRPHQACFDNATAGQPFYANSTEPPQVPAGGHTLLPFVQPLPPSPTFPLTLNVFHADNPGDTYDLSRTNTQTGQINLLSEVQLEFAFCAVMVVREPSGRRHFLKGFYWNANWQDSFHTTSANASVATRIVKGTHCAVGDIFDGQPQDRRFAHIFTQPQASNCNIVAGQAAAHPNIREEPRWHLFDVRR